MDCKLKESEINHLRRLLGWIRCDIGLSPEEMVDLHKSLAERLDYPNVAPDRVLAIKESYERAQRIPKYVRAAIKALEKTIKEHGGEIVDAEVIAPQLPRTMLTAATTS